jgi:hypothetical protein
MKILSFISTFGRISIVFGIVCSAICIGSTIYVLSFVCSATRVIGNVVRFEERHNMDNDLSFAPVISYTDLDGVRHTFISNVSSSLQEYKIGDSVPVLFHHENPDVARIDAFAEIWGVPLVTGILGTVFLAAGIVTLCRRKIRHELLERKISAST